MAENRRYFICEQPALDYAAIHGRVSKHLGRLGLSVEDFQRRAEAILARLKNDPQTAGIASGVVVPFILPRALAAEDVGADLDKTYLPAVASAFAESYPDYRYVNHYPAPLAGKLAVVPESRHPQLLQAMAEDDVVGLYFPCLAGFSVPAMREFVAGLPQSLLLAGGVDSCAIFIGCPGLLMRKDGYPPLFWLAALDADKPGIGFHFEAYGHDLTFNRRSHLGHAAEYWSSGLVAIG